MIHYALRCGAGHGFDGWYRDSAGFEQLAAAGLVECPHCGATSVARAPMAPALARGTAPAPPAPPAGVAGPPPPPGEVRAMLRRLRAEVERRCEDVGADFVAEARRQARGESPERGIYGEASPSEAEALRDEGIAVARIPWVPPEDA